MNILTLLTDTGTLSAADAAAIAEEARTTETPIETLLEKREITAETILKLAADRYSMPYRILPSTPIGKKALEYVPEESARHYNFAPIGLADGALEVGVTDPDNIEALDALQFITSRVGLPYKLYLIGQSD